MKECMRERPSAQPHPTFCVEPFFLLNLYVPRNQQAVQNQAVSDGEQLCFTFVLIEM